MKPKTAEIIPFNPNQLVAFTEFEQQLNKLEAESRSIIPDLTTRKGIEAEKSHIYKWRQSKSAVSQIHKEAKAEALEYGRKVDAVKNKLLERIEAVIAEREKPLKEMEEREASRVAAIKERIARLDYCRENSKDTSAENCQLFLSEVEAFTIDDSLEEFKAEAAISKDAALAEVKSRLARYLKHEAEQAELLRLRQQAEIQERKDREAKIAQEAAEKATREAEEKAKREATQREAEAKRIAEESEKAELRRVAELETAKRVAAEAEQRALAAEKAAKEKAEKDHREKLFKEQQEADKREADKKHRTAVNNEAKAALVASGLSGEDAEKAITAIAKHQIPHISIKY